MKLQVQQLTVSSAQKNDAKVMTSTRLHFSTVILCLAVHCSVNSVICHMSPCDALQEMKNEITKYSTASEEPTHCESLEVRLAQLERRVRSVEQPSMRKHVTISRSCMQALE
jgi:hypothetical protein